MGGEADGRLGPAREEVDAVIAASGVGWLTLDPITARLRATGLGDLFRVPDGDIDVAAVAAWVDPADAARVLDSLGAAAQGSVTAPITVRARSGDEPRRALAVAFRRVRESPPLAVAVFRDAGIDERRAEGLRLAHATRENLERLAHAGTWLFDMATMTLSWSAGVFRIHGLDPASYTPSAERGLDLVHPDDRRILMQMSTRATIEGQSGPFDARILRPDGTERTISTQVVLERDAGGAPARMLGAVLDVTEQRRREKMLADAQRTDALGRMAGGIAHDFNNLLAAMTLGLAVARRRRSDDAARAEGLDVIDDALLRAGALARQLLAFSRRQPLSPRVLLPGRVIAQMEGLLRRLIGERVALAIVLRDDDPWPVKIDRIQLEQIVLNLVVNARDAIADRGAIRIEVRNVPNPGNSGGPQVGIDIVDDGVGMSPELLARIFEPFFTTKRPDAGTGLGLATCVSIVQQARGRIEAASTPGAGTRMSVLLPRSLEPLAVDARPAGMAPASARQLNVLVVEDDNAVRSGIVHELEWQGHAAMAAASAGEAVRLATGFPGKLDLILTDVLLGHDDGVALARDLSARVPGARVLLVTGFVPGTGDPTLPFPVLAKPFTGEALARSIAEAIG